MHKKLGLICCLLLLVGCSRVQENDNYIENVQCCLNDNPIVNSVAYGYQYYVPRGVKKIKDYDYNQVFLLDNNYMYLYVDIISYFYNKKLIVEKEREDFYYQQFRYNEKEGYIRVKQEEDNQYFVSILYNYSKIEGYVTKEELTKFITLSSIILNNIKYNDAVIEKVLEGDLGKFSEFTYEVEKPEGASSSFSQILEEYGQTENKTEELPDE